MKRAIQYAMQGNGLRIHRGWRHHRPPTCIWYRGASREHCGPRARWMLVGDGFTSQMWSFSLGRRRDLIRRASHQHPGFQRTKPGRQYRAGGLAAVAGGGKFANGAATGAFGYLFNYTADLLRDEAAGGHTIERHVGMTLEYLQDRLDNNPRMLAASTYWGLDEATASVQRVFDEKQGEIDAWLQDSTKNRLVLSSIKPITSPQFFPIGLVLDRDMPIALPGNGVLIVLDRAPDLPNGFRVTTSYPTLTLPMPPRSGR